VGLVVSQRFCVFSMVAGVNLLCNGSHLYIPIRQCKHAIAMACILAATVAALVQGGCTANRVCNVCEEWENITIQSNTLVRMACGASPGPAKAVFFFEKGARDVTIVGPGEAKASAWPLRPGPNFNIVNMLLTTDNAAAAVDITYAGDVKIEAVTTDATTLARVYADPAMLRKLDFKEHKVSISGMAAKVVAGFGHVASNTNNNLAVTCSDKTTKKQWVVKQELHSDGGHFLVSTSCTMVDLQALMNMYGDEYETRLFPPPPTKRHVSWRMARIATACAVVSFVVLVLGYQPDIVRFWHSVRKSHTD